MRSLRRRAPGVRAGMGRGKAAYGAAAPRPVAQATRSAMRMAATAALRIPKGQPCHSAAYASAHDAAVWATLQALLGGPSEQDNGLAREVAALPAALGGLGLQSAELKAPAACWAAWADALPAIRNRLPGCAENYVVMLEADADDADHCLAEAARARRTLQDEGWSECPTWRAVLEGARPAPSTEDSAGDWPHGW